MPTLTLTPPPEGVAGVDDYNQLGHGHTFEQLVMACQQRDLTGITGNKSIYSLCASTASATTKSAAPSSFAALILCNASSW